MTRTATLLLIMFLILCCAAARAPQPFRRALSGKGNLVKDKIKHGAGVVAQKTAERMVDAGAYVTTAAHDMLTRANSSAPLPSSHD